jgi:hypothetical protein
MKKLTFILVAALSLQSCSLVKKTFSKSVTHKDSSTKSITVESTTTVTEKTIDTNLVIPATTVAGLVAANSITSKLKDGDTCTIVTEQGTITIANAGNDSAGNKQLYISAKTKEKTIPVKLHEKRTTTHEKMSEVETKVTQASKIIDKKKTSAGVPWYGYVIGLLFIAFAIFIGGLRAKKKLTIGAAKDVFRRLTND